MWCVASVWKCWHCRNDRCFVDELNKAGIGDLLPCAQVASSDGVYGNGLWSASPLVDPADDDVDSSASFMPGATVAFNDGRTQIRFVSVHTTSPTDGYWQQWKRSLDELGRLRYDTSRRYVSWAISTRPTTIRRSVISWEHGSRMRPNKRPGDWYSRGLRISIMYRRLRALTISYWIPACWQVGPNR